MVYLINSLTAINADFLRRSLISRFCCAAFWGRKKVVILRAFQGTYK